MVVHAYNISSTIRTLRQEDDEFKRSLGSIVKLCVEGGLKEQEQEEGTRKARSQSTEILIC